MNLLIFGYGYTARHLVNEMQAAPGSIRVTTRSPKKAAALEGELEVRKAEIEEMLDKIREAQKQREALGATAGRADARESIRGAEDLFDELDRMAEKIEDDDRRREAAEDLFDEVELGGEDYGPDRSAGAPDVDERLAELKRRMGKE